MDYIEVSINITPFKDESAEIVIAILADLPFDSFTTENGVVKGYIKREEFNNGELKVSLSFFDNNPDINVSYTTNLIKQENWNKAWESDFEPIVIDNMVTIKAPFHKNLPLTKYNIIIEPKMAFGTGHHNTTAMMVRWLLDISRGAVEGWSTLRGRQVLDMGTGTGVLAILSAKMGAKRNVHAIDVDITAVNSAKENCYKNRLHKAITTLCGDASLIQANKYHLILANINRNILLEDMDTYYRGLKVGGGVVLSGFYLQDVDILRDRAESLGFAVAGLKEQDEWASLFLIKKQ